LNEASPTKSKPADGQRMKGLLFTFALSYGGAVVALIRPFYGFLIYVCFGILKPESLWHWSVPEGNYSRIVAIGLLIGWIINGTGNWRLGRGGVVIAAMVGYWLIIVFGSLVAPYPSVAWMVVEPMAKTFLPIVVGATLIDSTVKLRQLAWVIVISQGYLAFEFNLRYYTSVLITADWKHGGLDNNGIAITMVTSVGLAFYMGLHSEKWWQKAIAFGCAALMAHVVLFSDSRGGMLSLLVTGAACFILTPKRPRDYLILLLGVALLVRLAGEASQNRFLSGFAEKGTVAGADKGGRRLENWTACWDSMIKNPFGIGPNHWPIVAKRDYGLPNMAAHSTWLQAGAELGFPGLICLMGIYASCIIRLWPLMRQRTPVSDPWLRYFARMVIAGLVGFLASSQFVSVDGVELPYYVALIGAGTLRLASQSGVPRGPIPPEAIRRVRLLGRPLFHPVAPQHGVRSQRSLDISVGESSALPFDDPHKVDGPRV
jgi:putative inorganic carbon (hco3(-)) transporter